MKLVHIHATSNAELVPIVQQALDEGMIGDCKNVAVLTTIQHKHKIQEVIDFLEKQGVTAKSYGQVLGCKAPRKIDEEKILFLGSGVFHPKAVVMNAGQEIICCNPYVQEIKKVTREDLDLGLKRKKGALLKFHVSKHIGVLISVKSGQYNVQAHLDRIFGLEEKYLDKKFYFFAVNTLDFTEMENFPFVEVWVNTMCPRIGFDDAHRLPKPMLNINDLNAKDQFYFVSSQDE
jgi:2-(3-amino-3-carboxypropyl)histidine synthase